MIEDINDPFGPGTIYRQQAPLSVPPLQLPPMAPPPPPPAARSVISPRFDSIATRSSAIPWSPSPLNSIQPGQTSMDRLLSPTYTKSNSFWAPSKTTPVKTTDTTVVSRSASDVPMISTSMNESSCCGSEMSSQRVKLGILGFFVGLLIVCIPLAVVLVLWQRK